MQLALLRDKYRYTNDSRAPGERYPSLFVIGATPRSGVTNAELRDAIQQILDRYKTELVPQEEIDAAIRRVKVNFMNTLGSNGGISRVISQSELIWDGWEGVFELYGKAFETRPEDIRNLAKKYLNESNRTYVYRERPSA